MDSLTLTPAPGVRRGRHRKPSRWARLQTWLDRDIIAARVLTVTWTAAGIIAAGIFGGAL